MTMRKENASQRPAIKKAVCKCGKPFPMGKNGWKDTIAYVEEVRNDCFRGNDTVNFYHEECKP